MAKKEIQLTEYEHNRLKELTDVLGQLDANIRKLTVQLRQLADYRRELVGRKAELVEMLANKYSFDPKTQFSLNKNKKLILEEVKNG